MIILKKSFRNYITKLITAEAKLAYDKIRVPLKNMNIKSKPEWEIRLKTTVKTLRQLAKMLRQKKKS